MSPPAHLFIFLLSLNIVSSLPLTVKRLTKPKSIEDLYRIKSPIEKSINKKPKLDEVEIEWSLNDKKRLVDFESATTRQFLEEYPSANLLRGRDAKAPAIAAADGFPLLPDMEKTRWKEVLEPEQYKRLVQEMRVPVKSFDERRYNTLLRELDLYRTQNYWETTRPHLEKKLASASTEEERRSLQQKIDEFHDLSFQRVLYYQKLPDRTAEKDFSKYYDKRVKGWEHLKHVPPFSLIQHAVAECTEKYGDAVPVSEEGNEGHVDPHYYHDYSEVPPYEVNYEGEEYLPSLNEEDSKADDLREERTKAQSKAVTDVLIRDLSDRSILYQLLPEQYRKYYDFLLFLRKEPNKSDFSTAAIVGGVILVMSLMQLQSNRAPYYITLGHLSLLSMLLTRGQPKDKSRMGAMMSQLRPQVTWSDSSFRLGALLTGASTVACTALFFLLLSFVPIGLTTGLKLRAAYALSLLPTVFWTVQFQIYENKAQNGQLWRRFIENIQLAKDTQQNHLKNSDIQSQTLKLGQSLSEFMENNGNDRLPIYQEYTYDINPEEIDHPSMKYYDEYEDDLKQKEGRNFQPRLYQSEAFGDEKAIRSATQMAKQIRNVQSEVDSYRERVKQFFEVRAARRNRNRLTDDTSIESIEQAMGVQDGFLLTESKSWVSAVEDRKNALLQRKFRRTTPRNKLDNLKIKKVEDKRKATQKVFIGEFGFRDRRPEWFLSLFGKEDQDFTQPIQEDFLKKFARKFGFYRRSHYQIDPEIELTKSEVK